VKETTENEGLDPAFLKLAVILLTGAMAVMFDTTIVNGCVFKHDRIGRTV
jgi:hypothetical protein